LDVVIFAVLYFCFRFIGGSWRKLLGYQIVVIRKWRGYKELIIFLPVNI